MTHTNELIVRAHNGDLSAREKLVTDNLGLIGSVVKRFLDRGYEAADLFQIGSIGLIKAVDKFDVSYNVAFSTYAVPMIMGEIKRFLRDDGMVKVSRTIKENAAKIAKASAVYRDENGSEPTVKELSEMTGISLEDIAQAIDGSRRVESIYQNTANSSDDKELCIIDKIDGSSDFNDKVVTRITLNQLVNELPEREKQVIMLRYYNDKTQVEIARIFGMSQVQVSRIEKRALLYMREKIV